MGIPPSQYHAMLQRQNLRGRNTVVGDDQQPKPVEREADLHNAITEYCKAQGWIPLHGSMAHRAMRPIGEWDFTILADKGRHFFVEVKTPTGKLTTEQEGMIAWARKLGHPVFVVRSMQEFLEVVK